MSVICYFFVTVVKVKLGYDDSLDAFGVHGIGGIVGALSAGLSADVRTSRTSLFITQLAYNAGRIASYTVAGVIAGLLAIAVLMLALDRYVPNQLESGPEPAHPATAEFAESAAEDVAAASAASLGSNVSG